MHAPMLLKLTPVTIMTRAHTRPTCSGTRSYKLVCTSSVVVYPPNKYRFVGSDGTIGAASISLFVWRTPSIKGTIPCASGSTMVVTSTWLAARLEEGEEEAPNSSSIRFSLFFRFDCDEQREAKGRAAQSTTPKERKKLRLHSPFLAMGDVDSDAPLVFKNNYW